MSINVSPEVIEEVKKEITKIISDIEKMSSDIKNGLSTLNNSWNDKKFEKFKDMMTELVRIMDKPKGTLESTKPKLEKLKAAIEEYNNVNF